MMPILSEGVAFIVATIAPSCLRINQSGTTLTGKAASQIHGERLWGDSHPQNYMQRQVAVNG